MSTHLREAWRQRIAAVDRVARGIFLFMVELPIAEAQRLVDGQVGAADLLALIEQPVGTYWGILDRDYDLVDIEDFAMGAGGLEEPMAKGLAEAKSDDTPTAFGEVAVVLIGERPADWEPENNNRYVLMGNSFMDEGQQVKLVEVRYNAGTGWRSLPARGMTVTAGRQVYYHGTWRKLPLGTILMPSAEGGVTPNWAYPGENRRDEQVWMTEHWSLARVWAYEGRYTYVKNQTGEFTYKDRPIFVYAVEPLGAVAVDRSDPQAFSTSSARVLYEVDPETGIEKAANWRAQQATAFWSLYDAVIATDRMGSRRSFDVWTYGENIAQRPTVAEAKAVIEEVYGPQQWRRVTMPPVVYNHYYFGPTTEMTDPTTILVVDHLPKLARLA